MLELPFKCTKFLWCMQIDSFNILEMWNSKVREDKHNSKNILLFVIKARMPKGETRNATMK